MSRSAARTAAARNHAVHRRQTPRGPRRVSGPVNGRAERNPPRARVDSRALAAAAAVPHPRTAPAPARPRPRSRPQPRFAAGGVAIASRVAGVALDVSGSRWMDRLVRSRGWVAIVAVALIGIVAMQVSMLKLNTGIGNAVETVETLERNNAALRAELSKLSSGDRIQALAGQRGFIMPAPGDVSYLRAGDSLRSAGYLAAKRMRAPDPSIAGLAGLASAVAPAAIGETPAGGPAAIGGPTAVTGVPVAPAGGTTAPATAAPPATGAVPAPTPPSATTPPASTAPATPATGAAPAQTTAPAAPPAPAITAAPSGGAVPTTSGTP